MNTVTKAWKPASIILAVAVMTVSGGWEASADDIHILDHYKIYNLEPVEFDCVSCSNHVHMDEMVVLPTAALEEEQTQVEQMPWLDRARHACTGWR